MKKAIALFDFDGTITTFDSVHYFYKSLYKSTFNYLFYNYVLCFWHIILYRIKLIGYFPLKAWRLHIHTSKFTNEELYNLSSEFYSKYFPDLLNPVALQRIQWHKNQGHDVWVISASYDFLLHEWAIKNDINLITNRTTVNQKKRYLIGKDVNFEAKVEYLKLQINLDDYSDIYAYGDSVADNALLSIAHFKFYKPFRN
jgi:HAD superfamily hydrolase (TIGR01490 family)